MSENELFVEQATKALNYFEVIYRKDGRGSRWAVAGARTGSRYEMTAVIVPTIETPTWAVAVFAPWHATYYITQGTYQDPGYFWKNLGDPARRREGYRACHGGDVYASLLLACALTECTFPTPEELESSHV